MSLGSEARSLCIDAASVHVVAACSDGAAVVFTLPELTPYTSWHVHGLCGGMRRGAAAAPVAAGGAVAAELMPGRLLLSVGADGV
eukprot:317803-Chlamydomonas_euryale.AAC.1